jgi:CubicO group peptidase (beta-lactamase class C family)
VSRIDLVDALAREIDFSGVVSVDCAGAAEFVQAYGFAHEALRIPNAIDTQFAIASAGKGFTALAVVHLIEQGLLDLSTTARSVLGADLPLIRDDVTIEHLLSHRSGIGDYLDEDAEGEPSDYAMKVPVHELGTTEGFLAALDGYETKFAPGDQFSYNNGAFVVLALIAERASGVGFHDLVIRSVCEPAGLSDTEFLRSDALPARAALGYLEVDGATVTNVFHLPIRGNGDGGIYSTAGDISTFWRAFMAGQVVSNRWVAEMVLPRSETPHQSKRYGLGFWLHPTRAVVMLEGCDAGVSFLSAHDPESGTTATVISNSTDGAWPVVTLLHQQLGLDEAPPNLDRGTTKGTSAHG